MIRRIVQALAAVAILAGGGLVILGGSAGAAEPVESGWWWKANTGNYAPTPAPIPATPLPAEAPAPPPPPNVGEGLMVAATPDGASAVAAVRGNGPTLTLTIAENGDAGGQVATLMACATTTPWAPATAGRWSDKPLPACDASTGGASVNGLRSEDGKTWTFAVGALAKEGGAVDVVIVPAANPAAPEAPIAPFSLVFAKPGPEAFAAPVDSSDPSLDAGAGDFDSAEAQATADSFSADSGATSSFGTGSTSSFSTPSSGSSFDTGSLSPVASPALPASEQASAAPQNQPTAANTQPVKSSSGSARTVGWVIIAIGVAAAFAASRMPLPAPKGLARFGRAVPEPVLATVPVAGGGAAGPPVGGLGRFARPRNRSAPSL